METKHTGSSCCYWLKGLDLFHPRLNASNLACRASSSDKEALLLSPVASLRGGGGPDDSPRATGWRLLFNGEDIARLVGASVSLEVQ